MLRRIVIAAVAVCALGTVHIQAQKNEFFRPKEVWNDTEGNPINAHGGGILYHKGTYYWYGEYKVGKTVLPSDATWERYRTDVTGVSCYSSKDLLNWKFEGVALKPLPTIRTATSTRRRYSNVPKWFTTKRPRSLSCGCT